MNNKTLTTTINDNPAYTVTDTKRKMMFLNFTVGEIAIEGIPGIKKVLGSIKDIKELKKEITLENESFDLEQFFTQSLDGAVGVITKNQLICCYSWLDHGDVVNSIYNYLYNDSNRMKNYLEKTPWQFAALEKGNVIIQFCSNAPSFIWLPEERNEYQYCILNEVIKKLQEINKKYNYGIKVTTSGHENIPVEEWSLENQKNDVLNNTVSSGLKKR